jgi:hypothetical protein
MEYIVTRSQLTSFLKRRFSIDELNDLVLLVKHRIEDEGIMEEMVIYDEIRNFLASKKNDDINDNGTEQEYWDSYLRYETPLVEFVRSTLNLK